MKKTSLAKWLVAAFALFALSSRASAADPMQTVTLKVPVQIDWPESDVTQAFVKGPPFLRCEIHGANAPSNPTSSDYLSLGFDKPLASASQPLMVDASGHYSGTVTLNFPIPAATISKAPGLSYWCYLAPTDTRATYLDNLAKQRGLNVQVDQGGVWKTIKK